MRQFDTNSPFRDKLPRQSASIPVPGAAPTAPKDPGVSPPCRPVNDGPTPAPSSPQEGAKCFSGPFARLHAQAVLPGSWSCPAASRMLAPVLSPRFVDRRRQGPVRRASSPRGRSLACAVRIAGRATKRYNLDARRQISATSGRYTVLISTSPTMLKDPDATLPLGCPEQDDSPHSGPFLSHGKGPSDSGALPVSALSTSPADRTCADVPPARTAGVQGSGARLGRSGRPGVPPCSLGTKQSGSDHRVNPRETASVLLRKQEPRAQGHFGWALGSCLRRSTSRVYLKRTDPVGVLFKQIHPRRTCRSMS